MNYQIDGGDNNDDTVGGLLQLFPLEAIQEFNFVTQRFKAEYGRSNGGVMNIVTKSGTNSYRGSAFTLFRDKSLNAQTRSARRSPTSTRPDYRRYQFGGSFGGPIIQNKAHFFGAVERTQQDTNQAVNTLGLFPGSDGVYPDAATARTSLTAQAARPRSTRRTTCRCATAATTTRSRTARALRNAPSAWSTSKNTFNSFNVNHNWVLGGSKLNEVRLPVRRLQERHPAQQHRAVADLPERRRARAPTRTRRRATEQTKWQFRDDFSWSVTGMGGLGHDFKVGVNWIHEPHLFATFNGGVDAAAHAELRRAQRDRCGRCSATAAPPT